MNINGPGLLDASGLAGLRASIRSLISDPDASVSVTVATPTGTTVDLAAGTNTDTTVTDTVDAHFAPLTLRDVSASEGVYQTGDRRLLVDASLLTTEPTTATRITAGPAADVWEVIQAEVDGIGAVWHLICRRST
jgi:hypothetical protein